MDACGSLGARVLLLKIWPSVSEPVASGIAGVLFGASSPRLRRVLADVLGYLQLRFGSEQQSVEDVAMEDVPVVGDLGQD